MLPKAQNIRGAFFAAMAINISSIVACGDGLLDKNYMGEPLFEFRGTVESFSEKVVLKHKIRVALAWSPNGKLSPSLNELREQRAVSIEPIFPANYVIRIFTPPTNEFLVSRDIPVGVAHILAYEDLNDDGLFSVNEIVGGTPDHAIIYAGKDLSLEQSPFKRKLQQGFFLSSIPRDCKSLPDSTGGTNCDSRLGQACSTNSDCGTQGECFNLIDGFVMEGGYCAQPETEFSCQPSDGTLFSFWSHQDNRNNTLWLKSCSTSQDCRTSEGYGCNTDLGACLPRVVKIQISDDYSIIPVCYNQSCGLKPGQACSSHDDCGSYGFCASHLYNISFPGGYCLVEELDWLDDSCVVEEMYPIELWPSSLNDGTLSDNEMPKQYWFKECNDTEDCRQDYVCSGDTWLSLWSNEVKLCLAEEMVNTP